MPRGVEISVNPKVIEWAIHNSDFDMDYLFQDVKNLKGWLSGEKKPTLLQLGNFSKKIHIPFGYMLLQEPPDDLLFSAEYRTIKDELVKKPSRALVETLNDMEFKMTWMRDYRISIGAEKLDFIGTFKNKPRDPEVIVNEIRRLLNLREDWALHTKDIDKAYNLLKERMEAIGVLVMKDSVVLGNTHRKLNIREFRAFVLFDDFAPMIFLNAQDSKAGRIFSLIHEFCHLLISMEDNIVVNQNAESYCNSVAASFLMPQEILFILWKEFGDNKDGIFHIAKKIKVSPLAIARRLRYFKVITPETYEEIHNISIKNFEQKEKKNSNDSGNPYATKRSNLSTAFLQAVVLSAGEGKTLYGDAFKLLNVSNSNTYDELVKGY